MWDLLLVIACCHFGINGYYQLKDSLTDFMQLIQGWYKIRCLKDVTLTTKIKSQMHRKIYKQMEVEKINFIVFFYIWWYLKCPIYLKHLCISMNVKIIISSNEKWSTWLPLSKKYLYQMLRTFRLTYFHTIFLRSIITVLATVTYSIFSK